MTFARHEIMAADECSAAAAPSPPLSACARHHADPQASSDCVAWPIERNSDWAAPRGSMAARYSALRPSLRSELTRLAARWLEPWAARGIEPADLVTSLGEGKGDCSKETPSKVCALVMVRRSEILLHIPPRSRLFRQPLTTCHHGELQGSSMRRLQNVLRLLRLALTIMELPDFELRLCVDDFCHGLYERKAVPWLSSVSCLNYPSIPMVQWNTLPGRDPDMAVWDEILRSVRVPAATANARRWACRRPQAVWRGAVSEVCELHRERVCGKERAWHHRLVAC